MFENIPHEMRDFEQWIVWRFEENDHGKPTKVPYSPITNYPAKVNDSSTWSTYENAVAAVALSGYSGIGFVLTDVDPYAFIDLDEPKKPNGEAVDPDTYKEIWDRQQQVFLEFDSYAELSPSGKGLHIIVKGKLESGRKRSSIEVYSSLRFMTMTGNVYRQTPIKDHNELLNVLWAQMGKGSSAEMFYAGLAEASQTDEQILQTANTAANQEKFKDLYYDGNWQKHYPSQSEADFALLDIIAFYSKNGAQTQRIFLGSKLAEREKSRAQYRLNYMLNRCFDKMLPPVDIEGLRDQVNAAIAKANPTPVIELADNYQSLAKPAEMPTSSNDTIEVPPGLLGEIAQFIYSQAPRPVAEIAIAGAIGLMSGIIGKAYNISNTGCNQYTLLLALTGTGKEAISMGITKLMTEVKKSVPSCMEFIGPSGISSEQSLIKHLANTSPSFVSILGEFGITMSQLSAHNANPHQLGIRRMLLDLYNKSGEGNAVQATIYSDKDKNVPTVFAPAFSIIGESTPETFYPAINEDMIAAGLLPRFTIIEYRGERPDLNEGASLVRPSFDLIQKTATLCANALNLVHQKKVLNVKLDDETKTIFREFNQYCDNNIRGSTEVRRQLWNRGHIKALKMAALIAVGINPFDPIIDRYCANWAIKLILSDIRNISKRFESGEIGADNEETRQLQKTMDFFKEYVVRPLSEMGSYNLNSAMHNERVIPYSYLHKRLNQQSCFRKDRMGATNAIKRTIQTMIARGDIREIERATMLKQFSSSAVAYAIVNPKAFGM